MTDHSITVTIGLPCYNAAATLPQALASIRAQTCPEWELVAVDDGSVDGTRKVLEYFAATHSDWPIRVVADGTNRGLAARLNQIAGLARGEFLARMDADDMMFPDRLGQQVNHLRQHPECDVVGSAIVCMDRQGQLVARRAPPERVAGAARRILAGEVLYHPTVMGRTAWFRAHPYDETLRISEDYELWARTASSLHIHNLPQPLLFYREYGTFHWRKYREQSRLTREFLRRYGPEAIGAAATGRLIARRRVKDAVYGLLRMCGLWRFALHLRNRRLTEAERRQYELVLASISSGNRL